MKARIVFIAGTDTGVGKTLLTALLLQHLRNSGRQAMAVKPFCSGGTKDVDLLFELQHGDLSRREINPYYFPEPVAPMVSARIHHHKIPLSEVVKKINAVAANCEVLLVEGSGGLLVPLARDYLVIDLISAVASDTVLLVSRNRLGTINHTLLSEASLRNARINNYKTVLMDGPKPDFSSRSNALVIRELLKKNTLVEIPFLGPRVDTPGGVQKKSTILKKTLARILS